MESVQYVMWWDGIAWQDLVSGPAGGGCFILHFCKFLILSNFRHWPKLLILLLNASGACR